MTATTKPAKKTAKPTLVVVRYPDGQDENQVFAFPSRKNALAFAKKCLAAGCETLVSTR